MRPGTVLSDSHVRSHLMLIIAPMTANHYPHFAYEETEAQRGYITCSGVGKWQNWASHPSSQLRRACPESAAFQASALNKQAAGTWCWSALLMWGDQGLPSCLWERESMLCVRVGGPPTTERGS